MIKVSVLVAIYNSRKWLRECLDSLLCQSLTECEFLCVDDGSTDGSDRIVEQYSAEDSRFRLIRQANQGLSVTRNTGIKEARGEYLAFLDGDDMFASHRALEILFQRSVKDDLELLSFETELVYEGRMAEKNNRDALFTKVHQYPGIRRGSQFLTEMIENQEYHDTVWLLFVRRRWLLDQGIGFYPGIFYEDAPFCMRCYLRAERMAHLSEKLYRYRIRERSITTSPIEWQHVYGRVVGLGQMLRLFLLPEYGDPRLQRAMEKYLSQALFHIRYLDEFRTGDVTDIAADPYHTFLLKLLEVGEWRMEVNEEVILAGLEKMAKDSEGIILYGAGVVGRLFARFLDARGLREKIRCFAVSQRPAISSVEGIPVLSVREALNLPGQVVLSVVEHGARREMKETLRGLGVARVWEFDDYIYRALRRFSEEVLCSHQVHYPNAPFTSTRGMEDLIFEAVPELGTALRWGEVKDHPNQIFEHFMAWGDEVIYVLDDHRLRGIVTPGDLIRSLEKGERMPKPNRDFVFVRDKGDVDGAAAAFRRFPGIHEVPVVKEGRFLGVLKSGERKSQEEWRDIRRRLKEGILEIERREWVQKDVKRLLGINGKKFIYRYLSEKDMELTDKERRIYEGKSRIGDKGLSALTFREQQIFFGSHCPPGYGDEVIRDFEECAMIYKNGIPGLEDRNGRIFHIKNGTRIVPNAPAEAAKKIVMVGPCTLFGVYTREEETVEACLQEMLLEEGFEDYQVVNCCVGGGETSLPRLLCQELAPEDMVIIMTEDFDVWKGLEAEGLGSVTCLESMSEVWDGIPRPVDHVLNSAQHCDYVVNQSIARKMFRDIKTSLQTGREGEIRRSALQDHYISWDVARYYRAYLEPYKRVVQKGDRVGAVVMTCNPFTKGHRFLVEYACKKVDHLYILVVEEDRFAFSFKDRISMVKRGTADLEQVSVLPSGKYVISDRTFMQYFKKDRVRNVEDMDYDVHIFGEIVAKELGIQYRFLGEEPFDQVTAKYNETIKRILPSYGIVTVEIPRAKDKGDEIISASKVRKCIEAGEYDRLAGMVPDSTLGYLQSVL